MSRGNNRERQVHPNQIPRPQIYAEVVVFFRQPVRGDVPDEQTTVRVFRQASYSLQPFPSGAALVVQEQVAPREAHVFHWEDIERLKVVPSSVALVETT